MLVQLGVPAPVRLPVVGAESARSIIDGSEPLNARRGPPATHPQFFSVPRASFNRHFLDK